MRNNKANAALDKASGSSIKMTILCFWLLIVIAVMASDEKTPKIDYENIDLLNDGLNNSKSAKAPECKQLRFYEANKPDLFV